MFHLFSEKQAPGQSPRETVNDAIERNDLDIPGEDYSIRGEPCQRMK